MQLIPPPLIVAALALNAPCTRAAGDDDCRGGRRGRCVELDRDDSAEVAHELASQVERGGAP